MKTESSKKCLVIAAFCVQNHAPQSAWYGAEILGGDHTRLSLRTETKNRLGPEKFWLVSVLPEGLFFFFFSFSPHLKHRKDHCKILEALKTKGCGSTSEL
jgi:hypothetical protein